MSNALIIDDEPQIRRLVRMLLESHGYDVREADQGLSGLQDAAVHRPDVVLLDLGLPDISGLDVLNRLREWSDVPVLILSVREQEDIKVKALECGADDYVTKPFASKELVARLEVIQRRRGPRHTPEIIAGPLNLNLLHHEAKLGDEVLKLTPTEFALLKALAEHAERIVTQTQIVDLVWPNQCSDSSEGLRVHINHLRKKLGDHGVRIVNEPGIGYRLTVA
jgi:two-component system, OmpR family, KDP operon response regulator KdpE